MDVSFFVRNNCGTDGWYGNKNDKMFIVTGSFCFNFCSVWVWLSQSVHYSVFNCVVALVPVFWVVQMQDMLLLAYRSQHPDHCLIVWLCLFLCSGRCQLITVSIQISVSLCCCIG